jgi:hypothetical protein
VSALTLPGIDPGTWVKRSQTDGAVNALADRHYSRRRPGSGQVGGPGRKLILVTPDEQALWVTTWPYPERSMDGLDAWRCTYFRNEGDALSSDLIRAAMSHTADYFDGTPADGWLTWIEPGKVRSKNPGYCFFVAGWWRDREWVHRRLIRLRAAVLRNGRTDA